MKEEIQKEQALQKTLKVNLRMQHDEMQSFHGRLMHLRDELASVDNSRSECQAWCVMLLLVNSQVCTLSPFGGLVLEVNGQVTLLVIANSDDKRCLCH